METMMEKAGAFMSGQRGLHYDHEVGCEIGSEEVRRRYPEEGRVQLMEPLLAAVHNDAPFMPDRKFA